MEECLPDAGFDREGSSAGRLPSLSAPIPPETPRLRASFDAKRVQDGECHRWISFKRSKDYGGFQIGYRTYRAHRVAYVWAYGEPNCDLHHTCGNGWCVNPEHLTPAASQQPRHRNPIPHLCAKGHELDKVNNRGERYCSICANAASRRSKEKHGKRINAKRRAERPKVEHEPRPCEVCGTVFKPQRVGSGRGRYCPEPEKSDEVAHRKWRDCMNERQRRNRLGRLSR